VLAPPPPGWQNAIPGGICDWGCLPCPQSCYEEQPTYSGEGWNGGPFGGSVEGACVSMGGAPRCGVGGEDLASPAKGGRGLRQSVSLLGRSNPVVRPLSARLRVQGAAKCTTLCTSWLPRLTRGLSKNLSGLPKDWRPLMRWGGTRRSRCRRCWIWL